MGLNAAAKNIEPSEESNITPILASQEVDPSEKGPAGVRSDRRTRTERRAHSRYHFTTTAEILDLGSGAQCSARTSDISMGGCFIDTTSPFAVGTSVKLRLSQEKKIFLTEALITSSMPGMGMGVKFVNVEPRQMAILGSWISQLSGAAPPTFQGFDLAEESSGETPLKQELSYILNELIVVLMRKGILAEQQGKEMLRRLHA